MNAKCQFKQSIQDTQRKLKLNIFSLSEAVFVARFTNNGDIFGVTTARSCGVSPRSDIMYINTDTDNTDRGPSATRHISIGVKETYYCEAQGKGRAKAKGRPSP